MALRHMGMGPGVSSMPLEDDARAVCDVDVRAEHVGLYLWVMHTLEVADANTSIGALDITDCTLSHLKDSS